MATKPNFTVTDKLKYNVHDIVAVSGECRAVVFDAIKAGHLKTFIVGRRRMATPDAVQKWIDYLRRESEKGRPVMYREKWTKRAAND